MCLAAHRALVTHERRDSGRLATGKYRCRGPLPWVAPAPYYRDRFGFKPGRFPAAEYASDRVLSLPLYPGMDDQAVDDTIAAVRKVVQRSRSVSSLGARR